MHFLSSQVMEPNITRGFTLCATCNILYHLILSSDKKKLPRNLSKDLKRVQTSQILKRKLKQTIYTDRKQTHRWKERQEQQAHRGERGKARERNVLV